MPKLEVSNTELAIISHALELFLQRYEKARDHWRFFAQKYPLIGARTRLQGPYEGLEDAHRMLVDTARPLVARVDRLLVESPERKQSPPPPRLSPGDVERSELVRDGKTMVIQRRARGKRAATIPVKK